MVNGWCWRTGGIIFFGLADGELARPSGKMSRGRHLYDLIADGTSNAAVFIGIGVGLSQAKNPS